MNPVYQQFVGQYLELAFAGGFEIRIGKFSLWG